MSPAGSRSTRKSWASRAWQYLNRLVTTVGFSLAGFGAACLGFLWPTGSSGFDGKILAGKTGDLINAIQSKAAPVYVPEARAYIVQYPPADLPAAKKVYSAVAAGVIGRRARCSLWRRVGHGVTAP